MLVIQWSILSSQSIFFTKSMQCIVETLAWHRNRWSEEHSRIASQSEVVWEHWPGTSRQVSEAHHLPLTLQPLKLHLKVLTPPRSSAPSAPSVAVGCWVHTIQLCRLIDATGQRAERSALNLRPLGIYTWHRFPLQSSASLLGPLACH